MNRISDQLLANGMAPYTILLSGIQDAKGGSYVALAVRPVFPDPDLFRQQAEEISRGDAKAQRGGFLSTKHSALSA